MQNSFPFKAIIKEASAGTGKTHSILNEIFDLKEKNKYEILKKILGVTFSESAAIELKERLINRIFMEEYNKMSEEEKIKLQNILLNLNFSTIHSFARKILKRFSIFIEIDPFFKIIDESESKVLFSEAIGKIFYDSEKLKFFYEILKNIKINRFIEIIFSMKNLHPYVFLGKPVKENSLTEKINKFYKGVEEIYFNLKKELGYLDFDDLEKLTYLILKENPDSLLFLEDFDEKVNFIFVDEFQDTNLLQWEIIKQLTEEWRAGFGAKSEEAETYGIFIVGDKKQSIYKFRGAERNVFEDAKNTFKDYYISEKLKKNYRSTKEIIDFVNKVFEDERDWEGEELIYSGNLDGLPSKVEINLFEKKEDEYEWVCNKICAILGRDDILIKDKREDRIRKIELKDIILLIRKRTKNFKILEEKLKKYNLPYVIVGGIGFYQEPEIKFLLSLLYALVDPSDEYALWNLKNSIFRIDEGVVKEYIKVAEKYKISFLIEKILNDINFWEKLNIQQSANVEKFLSILQNQSHLPLYQITKNFRELSTYEIEPKADIFSVHQNAIKIMTIHKAKGLEAPIVFLINIEDINYRPRSNEFFFYKKTDEGYIYMFRDEEDEEFEREFREEMEKEEKRILYVGLTRAMQFLFISGIKLKAPEIISRFFDNYKGTFEMGKIFFEEEIIEEEKKLALEFTPLLSFSREKKEMGKTYKETVIGDVVHKIIKEISEGKIEYEREKIEERVRFYLEKNTEEPSHYEREIFKIFDNIEKNKEIEEVIKVGVSENVKSEFPFICEIDGNIYEGVIDKILIDKDKAKIYDFKVFLKDEEEYKRQLNIYRNAVKKIFNVREAECYLVDLNRAKIIRIDF